MQSLPQIGVTQEPGNSSVRVQVSLPELNTCRFCVFLARVTDMKALHNVV